MTFGELSYISYGFLVILLSFSHRFPSFPSSHPVPAALGGGGDLRCTTKGCACDSAMSGLIGIPSGYLTNMG